MRFIDATVAAAAIAATATANHVDELPTVKAFHKNSLPAEWRNAKIVRAPESTSILDNLSRRLSHWMGFNKGNGFMVATAFSDDQCMQPIWESGTNVGSCNMAIAPDGTVMGSFRYVVSERKGRYEIKSDIYHGNGMCMGNVVDHEMHTKVDANCHRAKVHIDGTDTARSVQYSWLPFGLPPKIMDFGPAFYRGRIEFDTMTGCEEINFEGGDDQSGGGVMANITRWWLQESHDMMMNCYPMPPSTTAAGTAAPQSYSTHCTEGEGGPGGPVNQYFLDANCKHPDPNMQYEDLSGCHNVDWMGPATYGGARMWHSGLLGDSGGNAMLAFCAAGDTRDGKSLADKVSPWRRYKDINRHFNGDDDHDGGNHHDDNNNGGGGPGGGPCGCEDSQNWNANFCTYNNGANSGSNCAPCSNYGSHTDCQNATMPNEGRNDCSYRCFGVGGNTGGGNGGGNSTR